MREPVFRRTYEVLYTAKHFVTPQSEFELSTYGGGKHCAHQAIRWAARVISRRNRRLSLAYHIRYTRWLRAFHQGRAKFHTDSFIYGLTDCIPAYRPHTCTLAADPSVRRRYVYITYIYMHACMHAVGGCACMECVCRSGAARNREVSQGNRTHRGHRLKIQLNTCVMTRNTQSHITSQIKR